MVCVSGLWQAGAAMGVGLASKDTWLPPGQWVDVNSGVITSVAPDDHSHVLSKSYTLSQIPLWSVRYI